ncbi:beta-ketoacyl-ACP synthase [Rhodovarius crocodyli]|uniref:Beta-ketoacyl-ACP synthase n=1 Tax=Rhodovarius crocodyli TaxID=1979269 RepID=A0A437MLP8_9PROT|nr:beta-ketoacyl synthase N-terminal-like domain-containing protein [Rhodovarius crocodyli]RVT98590.1 beta-ketoacyl-ACP synthase [Rhodovarius crocodyli]
MKDIALTDHLGRPRVVVTGMGMVTALGLNLAESWAGLTAGRSGVRDITRFDTTGMRTRFGACVDLPGDRPGRPLPAGERVATLGAMAFDEALAQAGLTAPIAGPFCFGMPPIEIEWPARTAIREAATGADGMAMTLSAAELPGQVAGGELFSPAVVLARRYGTRGIPQAVTTACASGGTAIQLATEALRRGEASVALAGGAEASMTPETLIRFALLHALSNRNDDPAAASRPFSLSRDGFVMGDGAGALVLETMEHALARGATVLGEILGVGERADTFHRTRSSPDAVPVAGVMQDAIADSGLPPEVFGYINAHGTSTPENDKTEAMAIHMVFGEVAPPTSSTKSMIGHTLSAAGAIEAVICLMALRDQLLPPTINQDDTDPALNLDVIPHQARAVTGVKAALSNSFGFGGQNVCVALGVGL